jgi:hypothetical protein
MVVLTPRPGTDGNHSCGLRSIVAADEDSAAAYLVVSLLLVDDAALHAAGDRDDLPGHVARQEW